MFNDEHDLLFLFPERLPSNMASHRPHRCSLVNCGKVRFSIRDFVIGIICPC